MFVFQRRTSLLVLMLAVALVGCASVKRVSQDDLVGGRDYKSFLLYGYSDGWEKNPVRSRSKAEFSSLLLKSIVEGKNSAVVTVEGLKNQDYKYSFIADEIYIKYDNGVTVKSISVHGAGSMETGNIAIEEGQSVKIEFPKLIKRRFEIYAKKNVRKWEKNEFEWKIFSNIDLDKISGDRLVDEDRKFGHVEIDFNKPRDPELYESNNRIYALHFKVESGGNSGLSKYKLLGVDNDTEEGDYLSKCGSEDGCRKYIVNKYGLKRIDIKDLGDVGYSFANSQFRDVGFILKTTKIVETLYKFSVDYVDYSLASSRDMDKVGDSYDSALTFLNKYPSSVLAPGVTQGIVIKIKKNLSAKSYVDLLVKTPFSLRGRQDLLNDFYQTFFKTELDIVKSEPRPITDKSLASSMVGSCVDVARIVRIVPKVNIDLSNDLALDLSFKLTRTYNPYYLNEVGDPLWTSKRFVLKKGASFKGGEKVVFPCVLAAGRYHYAALSLIGSVLGVKKENSGVNTTLTKTSLDFDVKGVDASIH